MFLPLSTTAGLGPRIVAVRSSTTRASSTHKFALTPSKRSPSEIRISPAASYESAKTPTINLSAISLGVPKQAKVSRVDHVELSKD